MKKKFICLVLSLSIALSMTTVSLAIGHDNPKASRVVIRINKVTDK